jgi:NitT/TauT family transport system permease protein
MNPSSEQLLYLRRHARKRSLIRIIRILILIVFLGLWELVSDLAVINPFIFSSPSRIARCFLTMLTEQSLLHHIRITLYETLVSFVLVCLISIFLAVLMWSSDYISGILDPYLVVLNSLPKSALAPLLIVWLGATQTTIIVAGISVAIFGSILNIFTAFQSVDPEKIKLIYTLHGNRLQALTKVVLPASIPAIISSVKVNIGLCLVGVVIGEFLASRAGLGYLIIYGSQVYKLDWVILSILILCVIAMVLYGIINNIQHRYENHF